MSGISFASPLKPGEWVRVRTAKEILVTLNDTGTLNGLSFMPEMLDFCGRCFRVQRIATKACVNAEEVYLGMLEPRVILQTNRRCDGSAHGNCQMGCKFLWDEKWLLSVTESERQSEPSATPETDPEIRNRLIKLASKSSGYYQCQATELVQITSQSSPFQLKQYVADYRNGIGLEQIVLMFTRLIGKKVRRQADSVRGPCEKRTPIQRLKLEVGDNVRVKPFDEIRRTLDSKGCNRGLWFDREEMAPFCDRELVVSRVVHRLIDENTGELKELKNPCIVLSETECSGVFRRFCSRGMLHFWREIWLERVAVSCAAAKPKFADVTGVRN